MLKVSRLLRKSIVAGIASAMLLALLASCTSSPATPKPASPLPTMATSPSSIAAPVPLPTPIPTPTPILVTPTPKPVSPSKPDLASIPLEQALASGKPTLAEFGSNTCIPCKQMKPILEELAGEYKDKLNVVIVEVYEQMELTRQYGIMAIPTQIFFDSSGKEVKRHMGFYAKDDIIAQLKKMGIE